MFIIKKQKIFNVIFAVALICSLGLNFLPKTQSIETAAPITSGKVIVIDAGHGTPDGGAIGYSGTLEKDLNLQIAKRLGSLLQQTGANVLFTREDDNAVADSLDEKIREIKRSDLKNRKDMKSNSNADLFISIHMNKFEDAQYKGAQVFYPGNSPESEQLAKSVQSSIKKVADSTNTREAKDSKNSIFVLNDSKIPSILVECGFISNPEEEAKLKTDAYQDSLSFAIFCGIAQYFTNNA